MNFWQRMKDSITRWMYGRYGADQLSRAILYTSLALLFISTFSGSILLFYLSIAGYCWMIFRMFSRNKQARAHENAAFMQKTSAWRTSLRQARVRFKNRKQYKYFKCPQCGVRLRLTRGCGEKTIVCNKCKHTFTMKA